MSGDLLLALEKIAIYIVPALLGIILHEVAHGACAAYLGDPTAKSLGRLTLNPLPHVDPLGLLVFVLTSLTSPFVFGWAKPVPVNPRYFANPAKGMMLVALAGPATNFLLALLFALLLWLAIALLPEAAFTSALTLTILTAMKAGVFINLALAWLNLLPVPPLDGSRILSFFLPRSLALTYLRIERYGLLLLMLLLFSGLLNKILVPLLQGSANLLLGFLDIYA
ncbi:MAG: site-2 protease family protein [Desulfovibrio sp.]|nr:site-2 protease family protein [Desulfovibrio sp.]